VQILTHVGIVFNVVARSAPLPRHVVLCIIVASKKACHIATHVKKGCVLVIQTGALIRNTIVHRVVSLDFAGIAAGELTLKIRAILREVSLIGIRVARGTVQVLVTPLVAS
jgi:hypothetical protein